MQTRNLIILLSSCDLWVVLLITSGTPTNENRVLDFLPVNVCTEICYC